MMRSDQKETCRAVRLFLLVFRVLKILSQSKIESPPAYYVGLSLKLVLRPLCDRERYLHLLSRQLNDCSDRCDFLDGYSEQTVRSWPWQLVWIYP